MRPNSAPKAAPSTAGRRAAGPSSVRPVGGASSAPARPSARPSSVGARAAPPQRSAPVSKPAGARPAGPSRNDSRAKERQAELFAANTWVNPEGTHASRPGSAPGGVTRGSAAAPAARPGGKPFSAFNPQDRGPPRGQGLPRGSAAAVSTGKGKADAALRVYTALKEDELGVGMLLGDYIECGVNHERKVYKKKDRVDGQTVSDVFMYFWGEDDDPEMSGWWFGDQVGGNNCWSRCASNDKVPPLRGWKVPWDKPVVKDQLLVEVFNDTPTTPPRGATPGKAMPERPRPGQQNVQKTQTSAGPSKNPYQRDESGERPMNAYERRAQPVANAPLQEALDKSQESQALRQRQEAETRDRPVFQAALEKTKQLVSQVDDTVETVVIIAAPFNTMMEEEDDVELMLMSLKDIEDVYAKAETAMKEAQNDVTQGLVHARKYAAQTAKDAKQEYDAFNKQLGELVKKMLPFKKKRKEFEQKQAAKRAIEQVTEALHDAELEVEKAHILSTSSTSQMPEDDLKAADEAVKLGRNRLDRVVALQFQKARDPNPALGQAMKNIEKRIKEAKDKLEEVKATLAKQYDGLMVQQIISEGQEKVAFAEELEVATQTAEMPFLRGDENMPSEETIPAVRACEVAYEKAEKAIGIALMFIRAKTTQVKHPKFNLECAKQANEGLQSLSSRCDVVGKKLSTFKKETMQRKVQATLSELVAQIAGAEAAQKTFAEAIKPLVVKSIVDASLEDLQTALKSSTDAEKHAEQQLADARKLLTAKQKDARSDVLSELTKMSTRINTVVGDIAKDKKTLVMGKKTERSKQQLNEGEDKVAKVEAEVEVAQDLAGKLEETSSEATLEEAYSALTRTQKTLAAVSKSLQEDYNRSLPNDIPGYKTAFTALVTRTKKAQEKVDAAKEAKRAQTEKASARIFVKEALQRVEGVDASMEKVTAAELPFMKGIEVMTMDEANPMLKECQEACEAVSKAVGGARNYIAGKQVEINKFAETVSKTALEEMKCLTEKLNTASARVSQFKKETEERKRAALMKESEKKLKELETDVDRITDAAKPLEAADLDKEKAQQVCEKVADAEKTLQKKLEELETFLRATAKDIKGHQSHEEKMESLRQTLRSSKDKIGKAKAAAGEYEQRFVAKMLLEDANEKVKNVEEQYDRVIEQAALIVEQKGFRFLASFKVIAIKKALNEHMKAKTISQDVVFSEACGDGPKDAIGKSEFLAWLESLPQSCGRSDLTFSPEQREAVFGYLDADKDSKISRSEFDSMFREQYVCVHSVAVTDGKQIKTSKTLSKLEVDQVVEALGEPNSIDGTPRLECKVSSDQTGWVTLKGNQGTVYLMPSTPYHSYSKGLDRDLESLRRAVGECASFINSKIEGLASVDGGVLGELKTDLKKLKPRVGVVAGKCDSLKKQVAIASNEFHKREAAEQQEQHDAADAKVADEVRKAITEATEETQRALDNMENKLKALLDDGINVVTFETPLSLIDEAKVLQEEVGRSSSSTSGVLMEQKKIVKDATRGPLHAVYKVLTQMTLKMELASKTTDRLMASAQKACFKIANSALEKAAVALRAEVVRREITLEALFAEFAGGAEKFTVQDDVFCKKMVEILGASFPPEHATLVSHHLNGRLGGQPDGGSRSITKSAFMKELQRYFSCVKSVSMTDALEVSKGKSVRQLDLEEVVELLEGPSLDAKSKLNRIRGRALRDGTIGWISLQGNQGTAFLKKDGKPFYCCISEVALEATSQAGVGEPLRMLEKDEALEVLEGPRPDDVVAASRVCVKANKDHATGWITLKDRDGSISAEKGENLYICVREIAVTDNRDIKQCKVLRKLKKGEVFRALEGPFQEEAAGVSRIRGQSISEEDSCGWITMRGNAGSTFCEETSKHYIMTKRVEICKRFAYKSGEVVRHLEIGEAVELTEGPISEKVDAVERLKARALADNQIGWVTMSRKSLQSWHPSYKCLAQTIMQDSQTMKGASTVRKIEVGEMVQVLDGPVKDAENNIMRIRARADSDGAEGWITIRGNKGTVFLKAASR